MVVASNAKKPTKGGKQIVVENEATVAFYRNMVLGGFLIYYGVMVTFFYDSLTAGIIVLNILVTTTYAACCVFMKHFSKATYNETGRLLDYGVDLNMEGGIGEHMKDLVILTVATQALSIISSYFWLLLIFLPIRVIYIIWASILKPYIFEKVSPDDDTDEKKKKKLDRKMRMQKQ